MKLEIRTVKQGKAVRARGLVLIAENEHESKLIDRVFGKKPVDQNGLVGSPKVAECHLSDGYAEHYIYIRA